MGDLTFMLEPALFFIQRTARQAKERSQIKKLSMASKYGSDITKFFSKV